MRQTSSACRWSSTDWFGWNGGSNQNHRSGGKSDCMWMSAMRKRSRKTCPSLSRPSIVRTGLRAPSQATSHSQASVYAPSGVSTVTVTPSAAAATAVTRFFQRRSIAGSACARSTRYCSSQYCCRLTNAGRRWPVSGRRSKLYTSSSWWNTLPTFQRTPLSATGSPQPRRSRISSARLA